MENDKNLNEAKRIIAAASWDAARVLGAGVSKPCSQARYNNAARIVLQDPAASISQADRRLIASYIVEDEADALDSPLSIRLSAGQRADLENAADAAGQGLSEYARLKLLGPMLPPHVARALRNARQYARDGDLPAVVKVLEYICLEMGVADVNDSQ